MKNRQNGFTLVEIAIVLVIIGLLLGATLKGQDLIASARAKSVVSEIRNTFTLLNAYQDRFRALPGDDRAAALHLRGAVLASTPAGQVGNSQINGNWDSDAATDESFLLWQHLRLANLATGPVALDDAGYTARGADGARLGVQSGRPAGVAAGALISGQLFVCQGPLSGRIAQQVESTLDSDGRTDAGSAFVLDAAQTTLVVAPLDENQTYIVCAGL